LIVFIFKISFVPKRRIENSNIKKRQPCSSRLEIQTGIKVFKKSLKINFVEVWKFVKYTFVIRLEICFGFIFVLLGMKSNKRILKYDRSKLLIVLLMPIRISNMVPSKFNCVCRESIFKPNDVNIKLCDSSFNSLTSFVNDFV
jgi:hypothetical protein